MIKMWIIPYSYPKNTRVISYTNDKKKGRKLSLECYSTKVVNFFSCLTGSLMLLMPEETVQSLLIDKKLVAKLEWWNRMTMTCHSNIQNNLGEGWLGDEDYELQL